MASAVFLYLLDLVTRIRWLHPGILLFLPLAGVGMVYLYRLWGNGSERGSDLFLDVVHGRAFSVPLSMGPLVLGATLLTHLCGGSVGREGTAVQMGVGLFLLALSRVGLNLGKLPPLVLYGISAGFGSVFGTPLAGALFAIELPWTGRLVLRQWIPCLIASYSGHWVCTLCGAVHTEYPIHLGTDYLNGVGLWRCVLIGGVFGFGAWLYSEISRGIGRGLRWMSGGWWLKPIVAAILVLGISAWIGTDAYLGLGVQGLDPSIPSILGSFQEGGVSRWSWFWKLLLTAITLGGGFKGGEVTPLFFVGAALGNTVAAHFGWPVELFAALGFVAVFAGASHTPIACTVLGCEVFGFHFAIPLAVACFVAHWTCRGRGIYQSQQLFRDEEWLSLAEWRSKTSGAGRSRSG